ncbi:hypothetical protein [Kibdelosporangium philippinense]|uniref:hypothetical protein n=1 Tax=Kibdelosporangium philippinense TaxID=211113 RepID=UPI00361E59EA
MRKPSLVSHFDPHSRPHSCRSCAAVHSGFAGISDSTVDAQSVHQGEQVCPRGSRNGMSGRLAWQGDR